MYNTHDPSEHIKGLLQILISDKKRIGFLFGAGTSLTNSNLKLSVPAIGQLTIEVIENIKKSNDKYRVALEQIKNEIGADNWNIEKILSNLEQKKALISTGTLNELSKTEFEDIIADVKQKIRKKVSVHEKIKSDPEIAKKMVHYKLANWIGRIDRKHPIELFTTNYDFLFEIGLEQAQIPYCDGFSGSYEPFFCPEIVEDIAVFPKITKLWKLHGSLGWDYCAQKKRVIKKHHSEGKILIYPSHLKYHDSRKQPHVSLIDRIHNFLQQPDSVLIVCGYSFNDEHINERILSSLKRGTNAHTIALYYDYDHSTKTYELEKKNNNLRMLAERTGKLSVYGMRSAVIGCKYGKWKLRSEPSIDETLHLNYYFDEDPPVLSEQVGQEFKGNEKWTGYGKFILPDFTDFVRFLSFMRTGQPD